MKRTLCALAGLLALCIGWLAWSSRAAVTPPAIAQAPAAPAPAAKLEEVLGAAAAGTSTAPLEAETKTDPATALAAPAPAALESAGILVRGMVRDEKGQPVPEASLRWIDDQAIASGSGVVNGAYSIPGLRPGHHLAEISGSGWRREQFDIDLPSQPEVQERDFTAHASARIVVKLVDRNAAPTYDEERHGAGKPGQILRVFASKRAPPRALDAARQRFTGLSECGRFEGRRDFGSSLGGMGPEVLGVLELLEPPPLFISLVSGLSVIESREIVEVPEELVFTHTFEDMEAQLAGLRVRLLQSDGRTPVSKGGVTILADNSGFGNAADAEGRIEIRGLLSGEYTVQLRATGFPIRLQTVALEPGQILDLGDIAMGAIPDLSLRFDFGAAARTPLNFVLRPEVPGNQLATLGARENIALWSAEKDPTLVPFPGPGSFVLRIIGGTGGTQDPMPLSARPQRIVLADAPAGEIVVKVVPTTAVLLRPSRELQGDARYLIATAEGLPCRRVAFEGRAPRRIELPPGEYTIARIQPEPEELGKAQAFTVGSESSAVELRP